MKKNHIVINRLQETMGLDKAMVQTTGTLTLYRDDTEQEKLFECVSLEKGWRNNRKMISCIPPAPNESATYRWKKIGSNSGSRFAYEHIHILDVPDRTAIKIHIANFYHELNGCIAVGEKLVYIDGDDVLDLANSRATMQKLMNCLTTDEGTITIHSRVNQQARKLHLDVADQHIEAVFPEIEDTDLEDVW